jgi:hypothetical protein
MDVPKTHEAFEMAILQWLRAKSLLRPLAFGGGTIRRRKRKRSSRSVEDSRKEISM